MGCDTFVTARSLIVELADRVENELVSKQIFDITVPDFWSVWILVDKQVSAELACEYRMDLEQPHLSRCREVTKWVGGKSYFQAVNARLMFHVLLREGLIQGEERDQFYRAMLEASPYDWRLPLDQLNEITGQQLSALRALEARGDFAQIKACLSSFSCIYASISEVHTFRYEEKSDRGAGYERAPCCLPKSDVLRLEEAMLYAFQMDREESGSWWAHQVPKTFGYCFEAQLNRYEKYVSIVTASLRAAR